MFLIIRVTVRSCTSAGQRSLRLPQLCGEDGFSTRPADGRHSGAVSPVYTKISKILVIVHNVRGIWTIWCCWWWWRQAFESTTLPIWRTNSSLWSNFFLSGKKARFALWFFEAFLFNFRTAFIELEMRLSSVQLSFYLHIKCMLGWTFYCQKLPFSNIDQNIEGIDNNSLPT